MFFPEEWSQAGGEEAKNSGTVYGNSDGETFWFGQNGNERFYSHKLIEHHKPWKQFFGSEGGCKKVFWKGSIETYFVRMYGTGADYPKNLPG